jgi:hypothetical protein
MTNHSNSHINTSGVGRIAAPWAQPLAPEVSFERFGLVAERLPTGDIVGNLEVFGGLGGQHVPICWQSAGSARSLLALTIVLRMTALPTEACAPMTPFLTRNFKSHDTHMFTLPCGTRYLAPHMKLARRFEVQHLASHGDFDVITIPIDQIMGSMKVYIRELYPDTV